MRSKACLLAAGFKNENETTAGEGGEGGVYERGARRGGSVSTEADRRAYQ